jgi:hypothetical protein
MTRRQWRILHIDWFSPLEWRARWYVRQSYGPMIPLPIYRMLERREYARIIRGFMLVP